MENSAPSGSGEAGSSGAQSPPAAVEASRKAGDDFDERLNRLLDRLLEHGLVPFVGAGVSARAPGPDKDFEPNVWAMCRALATSLADLIPQGTEPHVASILGMKLKTNTEIVGELRNKAHNWNLGQLAEVGGWILGETWACKTIAVEKFCWIEPVAAHVYLAYLAREGLVPRVLSTNYDTCVERAFAGTFRRTGDPYSWDHARGDAAQPQDERPADRGAHSRVGPSTSTRSRGVSPPLSVITDVDTLRRHGARRATRCKDRRPVLQLYKINGCAALYSAECSTKAEKAANRIALTERQIQRFRENWARDLFLDTSRRFALFFVGFGSEEPQIRYTILDLTEELQRDGIELPGDAPNAPFLATFELLPNFNQFQILRAFYGAHPTCHTDKTTTFQPWMSHCFTGTDVASFDPSDRSKTPGLPADLLFQRLFQAAYGHLLRQYSEADQPFYRWLAGHRRDPASARHALLDWLYPEADDPASAGCLSGRTTASARRWGRFPELLEPYDNWSKVKEDLGRPGTIAWSGRTIAPLRLSVWLLALLGAAGEAADQPDPTKGAWPVGMHAYLPLREDSLLILSTLYVLHLLVGRDSVDDGPWMARVRPTRDVGLRVNVAGDLAVHLISDRSSCTVQLTPQPNGTQDADSALLRQVVVPSMDHSPGTGRFRRRESREPAEESPTEGPWYRVGRYARISASSLGQALARGEDLRDIFLAQEHVRPRARLERIP